MSARKLTILHVMGSPLEVFDFDLSLYYGKMCVKANYDKILGYKFLYAFVHPGGSWSFPADVDHSSSERFGLGEAMNIIANMSPDVIVSHMFCAKTPLYLSMFELMNIPNVGANSIIFASTIDKGVCRGLMHSIGLPIPKGMLLTEESDVSSIDVVYPCVVKPTKTENSLGLSLAHNKEEMLKGVDTAFKYGSHVLIEHFIPGREIRVAAIQDENGDVIPLPCLEYKIAHDDVRKFEDKLENSSGVKQYRNTVTSWVDEEKEGDLVNRLHDLVVKNHHSLQCGDFSILDCRVTEDGEPYILECNLFCSMSPVSVINKMVKHAGMKDVELFNMMIKNALQRNSCLSNKCL